MINIIDIIGMVAIGVALVMMGRFFYIVITDTTTTSEIASLGQRIQTVNTPKKEKVTSSEERPQEFTGIRAIQL